MNPPQSSRVRLGVGLLDRRRTRKEEDERRTSRTRTEEDERRTSETRSV